MRADGNCLFNSISYYLFNTQDNHHHIRNSALEYIRNNRDEFPQDPEFNIENYVSNYSWGDAGIIMTAMCKYYRLNITVYLETQKRFIDAAYVPEYENNTVYLRFHHNHYDLLVKKNQPNDLSPCMFNTLTWKCYHDYLLHFMNHIIPTNSVVSYYMNHAFFRLLNHYLNDVRQHASDESLEQECVTLLENISRIMRS